MQLRCKMTGPYKVLSTTPETITVQHKGDEFNVSNNHSIYDPKTEAADAKQQEEADNITDSRTPDNINHNPTIIVDACEEDASCSETDE